LPTHQCRKIKTHYNKINKIKIILICISLVTNERGKNDIRVCQQQATSAFWKKVGGDDDHGDDE